MPRAPLVFTGAALLLYVLALEVHGSRALALAWALLYAHLPHFASARLWIAALQAPLALVRLLLAWRLDLALAATSQRGRRLFLTSAALGALTASVLAYEVFMPLLLLGPCLVAARAHLRSEAMPWRSLLHIGLRNVVALGLLAWAKLAWTTRVKPLEGAEQLTWFAWLLRRAVRVALFHEYGLGVGVALERALARGLSASGWAVVVLGAGLSAYALTRAQRDAPKHGAPPWGLLVGTSVLGIGLFVAGYAVFLFTGNAFITATGQANRIAIAAALGLALLLTGLAGLLRALTGGERVGAFLFTAAVSACVATGSVLLQAQARYWTAARHEQEALIQRLSQRVLHLPAGAHLLIDGPCPHAGPAPVLEGALDATGLLRFLYRDPTLVGDMVTPKLRLADEGVVTSLYAQRLLHPYDRLHVFHVASGRLHRLSTRAQASAYFNELSTRGEICPPAGDGRGVSVFR
jgi:hypothetical protein